MCNVARKVLQKIYGVKKEADQWEKWTNNELMQMYDEPSIMTTKTALVGTCTKTSRIENDETSAGRGEDQEDDQELSGSKSRKMISISSNSGTRRNGE